MQHIQARFLWVQDETREKRLQILKVGTKDNFAETLTTPVTAETMNRLLIDMGLEVNGLIPVYVWDVSSRTFEFSLGVAGISFRSA